jgi:nitroreductase
MTTRVIPVGHLDDEQVRSVLNAAMAAPSPHNSQPWRFHCTTATIELHADTRRAAPAADLEHRELMLACGAALLNLRLAIRALGVHPAVQLLPDPHRPDLLAIVRPQGHTVVRPDDRELAAAILRRRTDHGPFHPTVVPASVVTGLRIAARTEQAWLPTLTTAHLPILRVLVDQAHGAQRHDQACPSVSGGDIAGESLVVVIGTFLDVPLARLQAGQAMQRVLLAATAAGLSASFLSGVVEVPATRGQLRDLIVGGLWPQAVLRLGYSSPDRASPRRDLEDVVTSGPNV